MANGAPSIRSVSRACRRPAGPSIASSPSSSWGNSTSRPSRTMWRRGTYSTSSRSVHAIPRQVRPSRIRTPCESATSSGIRESRKEKTYAQVIPASPMQSTQSRIWSNCVIARAK